MLEVIEKQLNTKLKNQPISSKVLLDRLRLLDENSRRTSQYQDSTYLPFYYYLSCLVSPKSIFNVGLNLGLPICCFLTGNKKIERILGFQKKDDHFYSPRIAFSNIKDVKPSGLKLDYYFGSILDKELEIKLSLGFDFVIISSKIEADEFNNVLNISWDHLSLDGFLVTDYINSDSKTGNVFKNFCKSKNLDYLIFNTRYGNGIVRK